MRRVLTLIVLALGWTAAVSAEEMAPAAAAAGIEVLDAAVGTAVENRELMGEALTFSASVPRVYCWTKVQAVAAPTSLKHVWSVDGKTVSEVPLTISVSPSRTWSYKTVWPGAWTVEITDEAGNVAQTLEFTVSQDAAAPALP